MPIDLATRALRRYLVGGKQDFSFRTPEKIELASVRHIDLYIHVPFCLNMCPYCPYHKIRYDPNLAGPYQEALLAEVRQYSRRMGRAEITSIYIGGGTPTTMINELEAVLYAIGERFNVTGDICVETNPGHLSRETVSRLAEYGVGLVSLGVQSFNDRHLQLLGRNYSAGSLERSIDMVLAAGFKSVNLDLMFALPGQTVEDVARDLEKATRTGAQQITAYPLFTFPYSAVGRYRKLRKVKMPGLPARRKMYRFIHENMLRHGFRRVSVWGFLRGDAPRYSSVTRDQYIGLGAGAGSHIPGSFYLNTFPVEEYIRICRAGNLPASLQMDFTDSMSAYYWLYWRFYDTCIPKQRLYELFGTDNRKLNRLLGLIKGLRMAEEEETVFTLNERGAFWVHLLQNYFSLNYINKIWSEARETPFPGPIHI